MRLENLQHKKNNTPQQYNYDGVPIFCTEGIHEGIFKQLVSRFKDKNTEILVLGSGSGAFEKRLLNHGYTKITSVEFVPENFTVEGTTFLPLDLNTDFSQIGMFDAIVAIEVIEHLENQFHFMRCIKKLLNPKGYFYLSTPNVEHTFSRIKFFLIGRLHWFSEQDLKATGHISPIFDHILKFNLEQSNLRIEKAFTNANIWSKVLLHPNWLLKIVYFVTFLISAPVKNKNDNEINLFEIVHTNK